MLLKQKYYIVSLLALLCCSCSATKLNADLENHEENPSIPQVNVSHLPSDFNMVDAYWEINNWKKGVYDKTNIIHNQTELESYLGHPLSYFDEEARKGVSRSFMAVIDELPADFFDSKDLIVTSNVTVPITFNIKFLDASLSDGKLSLNYLYNPESYSYPMYCADDTLVDLLSVDKGADISSIDLNIEGMPA